MKTVCVFCGSSMGYNEIYKNKAKELGELFLRMNLNLVYGGANVGVMKVLADTMLQGGAKVIGVMPRSLVEKEVAHESLSEMHIVESMQERKTLMARLSDAFIAMPGGLGTLDELAEMLTYNQLRIHDKPVGIYNVNGFFDGLIQFLLHCVKEGFMRQEHFDNMIIDSDPEHLFGKLNGYNPVTMDKWLKDIKKESKL